MRFLSHLWQLVFPSLCVGCEVPLPKGENHGICPFCAKALIPTQYAKTKANPLYYHLSEAHNRAYIRQVFALYFFYKEGIAQDVLHAMKYEGRQEIGLFLGRKIATALSYAEPIDALIPIPLHVRRFRERGYNQSEKMAQGIREMTGIPILKKALVKKKYNPSQAKSETAMERKENIKNTFKTTQNLRPSLRHILLVDDIATTGSTLKEAIHTLQKTLPHLRISIATAFTTEGTLPSRLHS